MNYKILGIEKKTVKACAEQTQILLGNVKPKKPRKDRAKETKPRNREEDRVRPLLAKLLERDGWELKRVEPYGFYGKKGFSLGDWWGHNRKNNMMAWIEAKTRSGKLTSGQEEFKKDCHNAGVNYIIVKPIDHDVTGYEYE